MMAVWVAQAMWWVAQAMWWEGCAGYVAVPGTFYIRGPTCKSCKISSKAEIPKLDRVWQYACDTTGIYLR